MPGLVICRGADKPKAPDQEDHFDAFIGSSSPVPRNRVACRCECPFCQAQLMDLNTDVAQIQNRGYGVPRPIIFILDRNGMIKAKLHEDTYKKRPPVELVIEALDKLRIAAR